jgi:hypothetical protein
MAAIMPAVKKPADQAYLLRLWFEADRPDGPAGVWRFSLEEPHTGARRGFSDFEALVAFLAGLLDQGGDRQAAD